MSATPLKLQLNQMTACIFASEAESVQQLLQFYRYEASWYIEYSTCILLRISIGILLRHLWSSKKQLRLERNWSTCFISAHMWIIITDGYNALTKTFNLDIGCVISIWSYVFAMRQINGAVADVFVSIPSERRENI